MPDAPTRSKGLPQSQTRYDRSGDPSGPGGVIRKPEGMVEIIRARLPHSVLDAVDNAGKAAEIASMGFDGGPGGAKLAVGGAMAHFNIPARRLMQATSKVEGMLGGIKGSLANSGKGLRPNSIKQAVENLEAALSRSKGVPDKHMLKGEMGKPLFGDIKDNANSVLKKAREMLQKIQGITGKKLESQGKPFTLEKVGEKLSDRTGLREGFKDSDKITVKGIKEGIRSRQEYKHARKASEFRPLNIKKPTPKPAAEPKKPSKGDNFTSSGARIKSTEFGGSD